jgi:hypothetical protein
MAISASQYNSIRDKVVLVMGTGATGYGQTLTSTSATSTNVISSTLWNGLRTDMLKARQHQTGVDESANLPILTRNTVISDAIRIQFDTFANTITTNQRVCASNQGSVETLAQGTYTSSWNSILYHKVSATFSTALAAKYFFNAGGQIRFRASRTGTAANTKDTEWTNMLGNGTTPSGFGTAYMDYQVSSTVTSTNASGRAGTGSSIGFEDLTTSGQQIFIVNSAAGTYTVNDYNVQAKANASSNPTVLTFLIRFQDDVTATPPWGVDEPVTGSLTSTVQLFRPSGTNVSVSGPTASPTQEGPQTTAPSF